MHALPLEQAVTFEACRDSEVDSTNSPSITYADAGVDIDRANRTKKRIKYLAHKTFPRGVAAVIEIGSWPVLPIFEHMQKLGNVAQEEMLRTFNMGLGMLLVIPSAKFKKAQNVLDKVGEKAYTVGRIVKGERKVMYT